MAPAQEQAAPSGVRVAQIDKDYLVSCHAALMDVTRDLKKALGWLQHIENDLPQPQVKGAARAARLEATQALMHVVGVLKRIEDSQEQEG